MLPKQESNTFTVKVPAKQYTPKEVSIVPSGNGKSQRVEFEKKTGTICDQVYPTFNPMIDGVSAVIGEEKTINEEM